MTATLPFIGTTRSCYRCGAEFQTEAGRICSHCKKPTPTHRAKPCAHLTNREKQLIALVATGKANKLIAYDLHLTEGTVKVYMNRLFLKVGVENRVQLAVWYLKHPDMSLPPLPDLFLSA